MIKHLFKLAVASAVGVFGMLVVWGCLEAWQISEWVRVQRIHFAGTQYTSDLSWYVEDRRAVWTVGDVALPPSEIPDLLLSDRPVVPYMIRTRLEQQPAIAAAFLVGTGLLSWLSTNLGVLLMRARAGQYLDRRLWSGPVLAAALRAANWRYTRYCAMSTGACAAIAWYLRFDRSASTRPIDEYFQVGLTDALVVAFVLVVSGVMFGACGWSRAVRSCTTVAQRERSRLCARCRYSRAGLADGPCPECGTDCRAHDSSALRALRAWPIVLSTAGVILLVLLAGSMREHQWVSPASEAGRRFGWTWALRANVVQPLRWFALRSCYLPNHIQAYIPMSQCAVIEWPESTLQVRWKYEGECLEVEWSSAIKSHAAGAIPQTWQRCQASFDADSKTWNPAAIELQAYPHAGLVRLGTYRDMLVVRLHVPPSKYSLLDRSRRQVGPTGDE